MKGVIAVLFVLSALSLFLVACTQQKGFSLDDARQLAVNSIMESDQYTQHDGANFTEVNAGNLSCKGCYVLIYRFDVTTNDIPKINSYDVYVVIDNGVIENVTYNPNADCSSLSLDGCTGACSVCPPCPECSSVSCQSKVYCDSIGFNSTWYDSVKPRNITPIAGRYDTFCKNKCGDGVCDEIVCQGSGCPCEESKASCPEDC